jgi:hypothetical protein
MTSHRGGRWDRGVRPAAAILVSIRRCSLPPPGRSDWSNLLRRGACALAFGRGSRSPPDRRSAAAQRLARRFVSSSTGTTCPFSRRVIRDVVLETGDEGAERVAQVLNLWSGPRSALQRRAGAAFDLAATVAGYRRPSRGLAYRRLRRRALRFRRLRFQNASIRPFSTPRSIVWKRKNPPERGFFEARNETRTRDPFLTMEVLYQLSYPGVRWAGSNCRRPEPRERIVGI